MKKPVLVVVALLALGVGLASWFKGRSRSGQEASLPPSQPATQREQPKPAAIPERAIEPPSPPASASSNKPLVVVLGSAGQPFAQRHQALKALRGPLDRADVEAIYQFLRADARHPGTLPGGEHVLKNDLMALLARQEPPPADLLAELSALARQPAQDPVVRDYALQHLAASVLEPTNRFGLERAQALEALWQATGEASGTLAGTALLGLHRASRQDSSVDTNRLQASALALATDSTVDSLARTAAL